jgi:beta-barrel assembly-enhancing protease
MRNTAAYFGPIVRPVAVLTLLAFTVSCATTQLPPISAAGAGFKPLPDEQALWEESRGEEEQLLEKVSLYEDPLLESYLQGVVVRLTPRGMAANQEVHYRVRVVEDPTLNAFAYPHGAIYVHTGLLARIENEDQLATILGHEMTHVEGRHMLRHQRSAHNKAIGLTIASVAASVVVAAAESNALDNGHWGDAAAIDAMGDLIVGLGLQLAFVAAVNGYGRGLETEADNGGFALMAASGYQLNEAPKVYELLKQDYGEPKKMEAFFFGNHPRLSERVENSKHYAVTHASNAPENAADRKAIDPDLFARRIRPVVRDDAGLNIELGRLKIADEELTRALAWMPKDALTRVYIGRLRVAQATEEKDEKQQARLRTEAGASFKKAVELEPKLSGPHRELGIFLHNQEDYKGSCRELKRYVELAPDADDADDMKAHIAELKSGGYCR